MKKEFSARSLDVRAFAQERAVLAGDTAAASLQRLAAEMLAGADAAAAQVHWEVRGELRRRAGGPDQPWMDLDARVELPMTCQRCLTPVKVPVEVHRTFRFVADERTAAAEDDEAEEDLLVASREFNLLELLEDELLMEMPLAPLHAQCPADAQVPPPGADPLAVDERPHPFAVLGSLRTNKPS